MDAIPLGRLPRPGVGLTTAGHRNQRLAANKEGRVALAGEADGRGAVAAGAGAAVGGWVDAGVGVTHGGRAAGRGEGARGGGGEKLLVL